MGVQHGQQGGKLVTNLLILDPAHPTRALYDDLLRKGNYWQRVRGRMLIFNCNITYLSTAMSTPGSCIGVESQAQAGHSQKVAVPDSGGGWCVHDG